MAFFAKQKLLYYKRFKVDIWGIFMNTLQCKIDKTNYFCLRLERAFYYSKKRQHPLIKDYKIQKISKFTIKEQLQFFSIKKKERMQKAKFHKRKFILYSCLKLRAFRTTISKNWMRVFSYFIKRRNLRKKIYFYTPFIYEWKSYYQEYKKYNTKIDFATLRVTRLFYIMYTYRQLKQKAKKAKRTDGLFEQNYMSLIECKLPSFVYRTSFLPNMFESINFVKFNNVWINKIFVYHLHFCIKPMDLVGFRIVYKSYIYWQFYKRLKRKAFLFLLPKFIYVSFVFLFILMLKVPSKDEIINALSLDMYRVANYAN